MKRKILKLTAILLILAGSFFSCEEKNISKKTDVDTFLTELKTSPSSIAPKESLPEWLVVRINEIEIIHSKDIEVVNVRVFKGEWRSQKVYFIKNTLQSCLLCEVYYENEEKIIWSNDDIDSFYATSTNWELIYEFGDGIY